MLPRTSGSLFETADQTWHRCDSNTVGVSSKPFLDYLILPEISRLLPGKYFGKFLESKFHIIKYFSEACFCFVLLLTKHQLHKLFLIL